MADYISKGANADIRFPEEDDAILREYSAVLDSEGRAMRAMERERRRIGLAQEWEA